MMDEVAALMREVAGEAIVPRFRALRAGDIEEKSPGEVVTVADRAAELLLAPRLLGLLPGSRVVGEEAVAGNAALLDGLGQGVVWLVDPLDGTGNFVAGDAGFATIVALLRDGVTIAGWLLEPVNGRLCVAELGSGAFADGERMTVPDAAGDRKLRGIVKTRFLPVEVAAQVAEAATAGVEMLPGTGSSALDYPLVSSGAIDFALYWRTLPWDHAAPALFLSEAGGFVARLDGSPYCVADGRVGLLATVNREMREPLRASLGI